MTNEQRLKLVKLATESKDWTITAEYKYEGERSIWSDRTCDPVHYKVNFREEKCEPWINGYVGAKTGEVVGFECGDTFWASAVYHGESCPEEIKLKIDHYLLGQIHNCKTCMEYNCKDDKVADEWNNRMDALMEEIYDK